MYHPLCQNYFLGQNEEQKSCPVKTLVVCSLCRMELNELESKVKNISHKIEEIDNHVESIDKLTLEWLTTMTKLFDTNEKIALLIQKLNGCNLNKYWKCVQAHLEFELEKLLGEKEEILKSLEEWSVRSDNILEVLRITNY